MQFLATSISTNVGLNPLYLLTGSLAAIVAVALAVRSIVKSMINRSREEAIEKQAHNEALNTNTKAIEKLDGTTEKLADKLDKFTFDATMRLNDQDRRMDDISRRLERIERVGNQ